MATDPLHQVGQRSRATDQVSFYDETLKKQIEGSFVSDGRDIHVFFRRIRHQDYLL